MTQYSSLYALAQHLKCELLIPAISGFPRTAATGGRSESLPRGVTAPHVLQARHFIDYENLRRHAKRGITTHDEAYLENTYNFHHLRHALSEMFALPDFNVAQYAFYKRKGSRLQPIKVGAISRSDVVVSLRIGDYVHTRAATERWTRCVYNRFLGFAYFELILAQMRFDRLFITSDEPFHPLVDEFRKYDPVLVRNDSPTKTMAFVQKFDRIAISESTYSWWAAYLSSATEIYFPIASRGLWGVNRHWDCSNSTWTLLNPMYSHDSDLYLRVDDSRYKYVHQDSGVIYTYADAPGKRRREDFSVRQ